MTTTIEATRVPSIDSAIASEVIKAATVKWPRVLAFFGILCGVGFSLLYTFAVVGQLDSMTATLRHDTLVPDTTFVGMNLALLVSGLFGARIMTSERLNSTLGTTATITPKRGRLMLAKAFLAWISCTVGGAIVAAIAGVSGYLLFASHLPPHSTFLATVAIVAVRWGIGCGVFALLGLAVGVITRNDVATVAVLAVSLFGVPAVAQILPGWVRLDIVRYLPGNAITQFTAHAAGATSLPEWAAVSILAGWAVLAVIASIFALRRQDI